MAPLHPLEAPMLERLATRASFGGAFELPRQLTVNLLHDGRLDIAARAEGGLRVAVRLPAA